MSTSAIIPPASASPTDRRSTRTYAVFLVIALVSWWEAAYRQGAGLGGERHLAPALVASVMIVARVLASAVEALTYVLWWRWRGERLPYARFLVALLALSIVDRLALSLAAWATRAPSLAPWIAPVVGPHVLGKDWLHGQAGLRAAFGSLGVLTAARVGLTAWVQAAALRRRLGGVLLLTCGAWLLTRIALWWTVDLLRGRSLLP